jgi:hypothetical protein
MPREHGDDEAPSFIHGQNTGVGGLRVQTWRNQTRHSTGGEEEDELVILRKPGSHLCSKGSVVGAIPGSRCRSIAHRPVHFTCLEPLAQQLGSLETFLGDGNQSNVWCRFHALRARKINMGLSDSRRCRVPNGLA